MLAELPARRERLLRFAADPDIARLEIGLRAVPDAPLCIDTMSRVPRSPYGDGYSVTLPVLGSSLPMTSVYIEAYQTLSS